MNILTTLILESIIAAGVLFGIPQQQKRLAQIIGLVFMILSLGLAYKLLYSFDPSLAGFQLVERTPWLPDLGMEYHFGVDGVSVALILLTIFMNTIIVMCHHKLVDHSVPLYLSCFFLMQGVIIGVFSALDSILFYFFYEATLIPLFISMGVFGAKGKIRAAYKLFLYTFCGSAPFLIGLIYLGVRSGSFDIESFFTLPLTWHEQVVLFIAFTVAFAVKIPMWPVHSWLPDAHTEAPTGGSIMLAALMLKVGAFGFLRFNLPVVPEASAFFAEYMIGLSLFSLIFIGLVTLLQKDIKRLIAYSSISHMGIVTMGIFLMYQLTEDAVHEAGLLALQGGVVQMVAHGLSSAGLFLAFGFMYQRVHSREMSSFGGIAKSMPILTTFFVLFGLSNIGLPGTGGFVGEIMVIMASFHVSMWLALAASLTLVLSASYTLWMIKQVFYGRITHIALLDTTDIDWQEAFVLSLLALGVLILGCYPEMLISYTHQSCLDLIEATIGHH